MCHMSPVTCQKKCLKKERKKKVIFNPTLQIGQSDGASRRRVCYQRGLPRLVLNLGSQNLLVPRNIGNLTSLPNYEEMLLADLRKLNFLGLKQFSQLII